MRHGIAPEAAVELTGTLSRIASVLERLDARLANGGTPSRDSGEPVEEIAAPLPSTTFLGASTTIVGAASTPLAPMPTPPYSPGRLLQEGLREVLAEIARVKSETEQQIAALGDRPATEEQRLLERTAFHTLGSLRRRQADLLYRMHAESDTNGNGVDPLTAL
jgi:hypothetical protein